MKILSVRFRNLNSLRKDSNDFFEIDFEQVPLRDAGLFAIIGATGAGKSTILDAICLGLYGNAPRFEVGKGKNPYEILSKHTSDCFAAVDFEVKNQKYTSIWQLTKKTKRNGEIDFDRKLTIAKADGKIIEANKVTAFEKSVEEITGLDYERFLRSVMLAQGDFAKFLKANKDEKGILLEKITDIDIYSRLAEKAKEKRSEEDKKLKILQAQIDETRLLSEEQKQGINTQLFDLQETRNILTEKIETTTQQIHTLQEIAQLKKQLTDFQATYQNILTQKTQAQADFDSLEKHEKASQFKGEVSEIQTLTELITKETTSLNKAIELLPLKQEEQEKVQKEVVIAQEKLTQAEARQSEEFPKIEQAEKLDFQLTELLKGLSKTREQIGSQSKKADAYYQQKDKVKQEIEVQKSDLQNIKTYLSTNEQDKNLTQDLGIIHEKLNVLFDLKRQVDNILKEKEENANAISKKENEHKVANEDLEKYKNEVKKIEQLQQTIQSEADVLLKGNKIEDLENLHLRMYQDLVIYEKLSENSKKYNSIAKQAKELAQEIAVHEQEEAKYTAHLNHLTEKQRDTKEKMDLAIQLFESEKVIQSYEETRKSLQDGKECPVCGAIHHPWANYHTDIEEKEKSWKTYQNEVDKIAKEIKQGELSLKEIEVKRKQKAKQISDNQAEMAKEILKFQQNLASVRSFLLIEETEKWEQQLTDKKQETNKLKAEIDNIAVFQNKLEKLEKEKEKWEIKIQEVEKELVRLSTSWENLQKEKQNIEINLAQTIEKGKLGKELLISILQAYKETIPLEKEKDTWFKKLEGRMKNYQQSIDKEILIVNKITNLEGDEKQLASSIAELTEQVKALNKEHETLQSQFKKLETGRKEVFGEKDTQKEKEVILQTIKNEQDRLKKMESMLAHLSQETNILKSNIADTKMRVEENQKQLETKSLYLLQKITPDFEHIIDLEKAFLTTEKATLIRKLKEEINAKQIESETNISRLQEALKNITLPSGDENDSVALTQILEKYKQEQDEANKLSNELTFQVRENDNLEKQFAEKRKEIDKQKKEFWKWNELAFILNGDDRKKIGDIRNFAQSLTLSQLILLANKHLDKLNPRYHLRKKENTELDMEILDKDQADNIRSINTLSGGETFLVSLALALGLSDLATAGRQTQIRSLFIDEGFGTLDPRTLDETITTLENLQLGGKQIGIISHVEELKMRISTQIQVHKRGNGVSEILVVG